MLKLTKSLIVLLSLTALLSGGFILAENEADPAISDNQDVALDEEVTATDLGVGEPTILPHNPFYFFKEIGRNIQSALAFDNVKKAQLKEKFNNEKLLEVKKMVAQNKPQERIQMALDDYQQSIQEAKTIAERIKEGSAENVNVDGFLNKLIQQQTLQQRILDKLETQVSSTTLDIIKTVKERNLEKLGETINRLEENKERIQERLEKNLEEVKGSDFKNFKNLEFLQKLEEKVPEQAREAIQKAQENALKRLQGDIEKMSPQDQERFSSYIENIGITEDKKVEILDSLREKLNSTTTAAIKENLIQVRAKLIEKVQERAAEENCPSVAKPADSFCPKGRVIIEKDESGCVKEFKCVIPAETSQNNVIKNDVACITLWDPVCGTDNKTYSNKCFATQAGIEVNYKGSCDTGRKPADSISPGNVSPAEINCQNLWWYDNQNRNCQEKKFCGVYMYLGLRTFDSKEKCLNSLLGAVNNQVGQ